MIFRANEMELIKIICSRSDLCIHFNVEKFRYKPIIPKVKVYGIVMLLKKRSIKKPLKIKKYTFGTLLTKVVMTNVLIRKTSGVIDQVLVAKNI